MVLDIKNSTAVGIDLALSETIKSFDEVDGLIKGITVGNEYTALKTPIKKSELDNLIKNLDIGLKNFSDLSNIDPLIFLNSGLLISKAYAINQASKAINIYTIFERDFDRLISETLNAVDSEIFNIMVNQGGKGSVHYTQLKFKEEFELLNVAMKEKRYVDVVTKLGIVKIKINSYLNALSRASSDFPKLGPIIEKFSLVENYLPRLSALRRVLLPAKSIFSIAWRSLEKIGIFIDVTLILTGGVTCNKTGLDATFQLCPQIKENINNGDFASILNYTPQKLIEYSSRACLRYYNGRAAYTDDGFKTYAQLPVPKQPLLPLCGLTGNGGYFQGEEFQNMIKVNFKNILVNIILLKTAD